VEVAKTFSVLPTGGGICGVSAGRWQRTKIERESDRFALGNGGQFDNVRIVLQIQYSNREKQPC
jgi:hypothetical protein